MPSTYSYPGVYIEEIPSGVRTITGVSTSNTAFLGYFRRGPMNKAVRLASFADFERTFGGLDPDSEASYAIQQYYLNGGSIAYVVRAASGTPQPAALQLQGGSPLQDTLEVQAKNEGIWGRRLQVAVVDGNPAGERFNLVVREVSLVNGRTLVLSEEFHRNLSMTTSDSRYVVDVVNAASTLLNINDEGIGLMPVISETNPNGSIPDDAFRPLTGGSDGNRPDATALQGSSLNRTGIYALEEIAPEIFNILCIPGSATLNSSGFSSVVSAATQYCEEKRAFFIIDIPSDVNSEAGMRNWMQNTGDSLRHANAAVYFPRLLMPDPLNEFRPRNIGTSGTIAGIFARTDSARGVWKAPAGTEAGLKGVSLAVKITDLENGALNPLGVNVLRTFPVFGNIGWGARTMEGADQMASEWKYIPVRRTALFIEESLYQALKWVVFEPNDEPLWAQIRLNVGAFMHTLFRQSAFQGSTPKDAYLVKCDSETTTQTDINLGVVNIVVGFAPLKPAEFVVIKIQQLAGQIES